MKSITIFTPTYNRANCLHKLYNSLCQQSCNDFHWLIIDDGSSDNTDEIVNTWITEEKISIEYHYQENKGKLAAQILACDFINTELFLCIDSDDFIPDDAISKIKKFWTKNGDSNASGIIGLDAYTDGQISGTMLPKIKECTYSELIDKYKIRGDKKYIFNTRVFKSYLPYPYFPDEKFHEISAIFFLIDQKHKFLLSNEVYCIIEYLDGGLTNGIFHRYKNSPKSFASYRSLKMKYAVNYKSKFKNAIHYVSSSIFARNKNYLSESPKKITTILATPFGILLYLYINRKTRNQKTRIKNGKLK